MILYSILSQHKEITNIQQHHQHNMNDLGSNPCHVFNLSLCEKYSSFNLSDPANTPAPAAVLRIFALAPFIIALNPSSFMI